MGIDIFQMETGIVSEVISDKDYIIRKNGFSEYEYDLISLMANAIGNFILLQNKEKSLLQLNEGLKNFVGYVVHDLRNLFGIHSDHG